MTVQTRGLLEADSENVASESLLHSHAVNHSRTLRCTDEVAFHSQHFTNNDLCTDSSALMHALCCQLELSGWLGGWVDDYK